MPQPDDSPNTDEAGPYLLTACFCKEAYVDKETGALNIIGVATRFEVEPGIGHIFQMFIAAVERDSTRHASMRFEVRMADPTGKEFPGMQDAFVTGRAHEVVHWQFQILMERLVPGTYWAIVRINDRVMTRVPLHVVFRLPSELTVPQ